MRVQAQHFPKIQFTGICFLNLPRVRARIESNGVGIAALARRRTDARSHDEPHPHWERAVAR